MMVTAATRALALLLLTCVHTCAAALANCTIVGYRYDPPQMSGTLRTISPTWQSCQTLCSSTIWPVKCAHFAFWPDSGCHLQNDSAVLILATEPYGGDKVISGPPSCDDQTLWPVVPGQESTSPAAAATASTGMETTTTAAPTTTVATITTTTTPPVFAYVDIEMKNLDADSVPNDKLGDLIATYAHCIARTAGLSESQVVDMHGEPGVTLSPDDHFVHVLARRLQSTDDSNSTVAPAPKNYITFITAKLLEYEDEEVKDKLEGNTTFYEHLVTHTLEVIGVNSSAIKQGGLEVAHVHVHDKSMEVKETREVKASSGGTPWWGYVLIILAIVACLAVVIYLTMCQGGEKKKKSKKETSKRKSKKITESAAGASTASTTPLVQQAAPQPVETVAEPVAMYTSVPATSPTMAMAAPALMAPAVQPLEFMQMQPQMGSVQMGSIGSPMRMQQPVMMQPQMMVQPQMQPQVMMQPQVVYQQY